jgi:hypothetical protein
VIYPATLNIEILQNSTFKVVFRVLERYQPVKLLDIVGGNPFFSVPCHKLTANTKVVFVPIGSGSANLLSDSLDPDIPCGINLNSVYFVSSTGLTGDVFTVSATSGGSPITVSEECCENPAIWVGQPSNLTGYTLDADLVDPVTGTQAATFTCTLEDAANGLGSASMTPAVTSPLQVKDYVWDLSLTNTSGERYYYLTGAAPIRRTYSRNT